VETRAQLEKKLAQKEKEKKEENLRLLAQKAREERAGIRRENAGGKKYFNYPHWRLQYYFLSVKLLTLR